jgi:DNA-directed RNA polymerase specialized sigma24 family protein
VKIGTGEWMSVITLEIALREPKLSADERAFALDAEFAALVERQSRFVFRIAYTVLRNVHDAEDAAQDVFLKLYRTKAWKKMCDERAFLARATWRMAVDRARRNAPGCKEAGILSQVSIEQQLIRADQDAAGSRAGPA